MIDNVKHPILSTIVILLFFTLPFSIQDAKATNYNLKDHASCVELTGTWKPIPLTRAIDGLHLGGGDKLLIDSGVHLENIGVITNNGGTIYDYGSIFEGLVPYGNQVKNICHVWPSIISLSPSPLKQTGHRYNPH